MAESTQRVVSDGTLVSLGLSIDFIKQADISVFYNGTPAGVGTWSWTGPLTIGFSPAVPNGVEVLLRRSTERGEVLNVFKDGAAFNNDSMDTNFKQTLFLTQEALEGAALTDAFADVDFHGFRPTNLGTAVNPGDAVSLAQYQADVLGAYAHRLAAAVSAAEAAASAAAAAAYALSINPSSFATAAQGMLADTALQPGEAATPAQGGKADTALQPGQAATPAQGALADTALQSIPDSSITAPKLSGSQSGGAPVYGARAWCVFNGTLTGTNAPLAGGNVTSVTRNGVGDYTVTFNSTLPSAEYVVVTNAVSEGNVPVANVHSIGAQLQGSVRLIMNNGAGGTLDRSRVHVLIVG